MIKKNNLKLYNTLSHHSFSNLYEACNVGTCNEVVAEVVFLASCNALLEDVYHDVFELSVNFFFCEYKVFGILSHFDA